MELPTEAQWQAAARLVGGAKNLVARRSVRFRELEPDLEALSDDEIVALLLEEPRMARRPLLLTDAFAVVGFSEGEFQKAFGKDG